MNYFNVPFLHEDSDLFEYGQKLRKPRKRRHFRRPSVAAVISEACKAGMSVMFKRDGSMVLEGGQLRDSEITAKPRGHDVIETADELRRLI